MTRHYYAAGYPYGIRTVCNEYNPATVFRFRDAETRDSFVDDRNAADPFNPHYEAITAREARRLADVQDVYTHYPDGCLVNLWFQTHGYYNPTH